MQVIIDRFEAEYAVVELPDRTTALLAKVLVPEAREGDLVEIVVNKKATIKRKQAMAKLAGKLWTD
ncbi:MAG TPA: DUF3006 domain-containing protein [Bacillota bacterium]